MSVLVVCPVLGRPHRIVPFLQSLEASQREVLLGVMFVVSHSDRAERRMLERVQAPHCVVPWEPDRGDFARKTNWGMQSSEYEWLFSAGDDLAFGHGWADEALAVAEKTGKRFIATNDLHNPLVKRGQHATHPLVHRSYVELGTIDEPGKLYHEGYDHQCVDVEATETAMMRREFAFAARSRVEHLHFLWRKSERDPTYDKAMRHGHDDKRLLQQRRHLWRNVRVPA